MTRARCAFPVTLPSKPRPAEAADKAQALARKLGEAATGGDLDAARAAFAALGKEGCGGCHETFRRKQN